MKKMTLFASIFSLIVLCVFLIHKDVVDCELVGAPKYIEISDDFYVSKNFSKQDHTELQSNLLKARNRVEETFGKLISSPKIVITNNAREVKNLGSNETATAHLSFMGECLVFGPQGNNIDVFSHELVHAEVHNRLGWFSQITSIPVWFNEGIALVVDHRPPYLPENIYITNKEIEEVKSKKYGYQFFGDNAYKNYQSARIAVETVDPKLLYSKLEDIRNGKSFADAFEMKNK